LINFIKIISSLLSLALIIPMHALAFSVGDIPCRTYVDTTVKLDISAKFDPVLQKVIITWPRCVGTDTVCVVLDATQANTLPTTLTKIWDINPSMPGLTEQERLSCGFAPNTPPIASNLTYDVSFFKVRSLPGNDADGDSLVYSVVTETKNGMLGVADYGLFVYIPDIGFSGTDSFTYLVNDGIVVSNVGTITLIVQ